MKEFEENLENCFNEDVVRIKPEIEDRKAGAAGVEKNNDPSEEWTKKLVEKYAEWWGEGWHTAADLKKNVREELNATKDDQRR